MQKKRNYRDPKIRLDSDIPPDQAKALNTHPAVIAAINAVASERRPAMVIWKSPTGTECDHIVMALEDYIYFGDFEPAADGVYAWDADEIRL
jgi:hypothetical protein